MNDNELPDEPAGVAASWQRLLDAAGQQLALNDALLVLPSTASAVPLPPDVVSIATSWQGLPAHIREAILTLVEAGVNRQGPQILG